MQGHELPGTARAQPHRFEEILVVDEIRHAPAAQDTPQVRPDFAKLCFTHTVFAAIWHAIRAVVREIAQRPGDVGMMAPRRLRKAVGIHRAGKLPRGGLRQKLAMQPRHDDRAVSQRHRNVTAHAAATAFVLMRRILRAGLMRGSVLVLNGRHVLRCSAHGLINPFSPPRTGAGRRLLRGESGQIQRGE